MTRTLASGLLLFLASLSPSLPEARLAPQRSVLESGLVLLTSEQRSLPMVTLDLVIRAGARYDPSGQEGVASLVSRLLTDGTSQRSALEISDTVEFIGASLETACRRELARITLTLLKKDLPTGLNLLAEILADSNFPSKEIDRQKQSMIASIKAKRENPREIAQERFLSALFPENAYGRPLEGTEDSVKRIDRSMLIAFQKRFYRPDRAILAVVGDISHDEMVENLARAWRPWTPAGSGPSETVRPPSPGPTAFIRHHRSLTQANIVMGHNGLPRSHPDHYAVRVMNYILGGGGLSSRLADSIRNDRGLAYSVYSRFTSGKLVGRFQVMMQTKNETAREAIGIVMEEIRKLRQHGVSETELREAKDYLIGSFPLRLSTNRRMARFLARLEFLGLGLDYLDRRPDLIRRVSREDVLRAARTYLLPDELIVVVVAHLGKAGLKK